MLKTTARLPSSAAMCLAIATTAAQADIRIGVLVPDSGPAGLFGPSARNSAILAANEINANGERVRQSLIQRYRLDFPPLN